MTSQYALTIIYRIYNFVNESIKAPQKINKTEYELPDNNCKFTCKPIDIIKLILEKLDSNTLRGYVNYIKIKFLELYTTDCKKKNCFSCS